MSENDDETALDESDPVTIGDDQDDVDRDGQTEEVTTRHWLTNDALALWLLGSFPLLVAVAALEGAPYGVDVNLATVPEYLRLTYAAVVATAAVWTFGKDAFEWVGNKR